MIRKFILIAAMTVPTLTFAEEPARDAILADYAKQAGQVDTAFTRFSAERGEALFRTDWVGGDPRTPSCTSCHTDNPRGPGRNAKTGRPIDPVAVSVNATRFTNPDDVEKQFGRDCKSVMDRACTALEKGDYITFMKGQ